MGAAPRSRPRRFCIVVQGELSDRFASAFEGMRLERRSGTTALVGDVVDQGHLHGLVDRIESLGLELLSVNPVEDQSAGVR